MTTTTTPAMPDAGGHTLQLLPLTQLRESPLNTRRHYDPAKLHELRDSIEKSGILVPLTVRPNARLDKKAKDPVFEIAAGHRRLRAALLVWEATKKRAAAEGRELAPMAVPCIVRDLDDATFLEVLTIDNLQREDVHPLEEAEGYKNLLTLDGYDVARIAQRIGKKEPYVHDRLKLLQLSPKAKRLFLALRFTLGHAIVLARIPKQDQDRALDYGDGRNGAYGRRGGMWEYEGDAHDVVGLTDLPGLQPIGDGDGNLKPVSVRQLQAWVDNHVRFKGPDAEAPHLFAETAANLAQAEETKAKVVEISRDHQLQDDAKHPDGKRTYCRRSWKRADGQPDTDVYGDDRGKPSKSCDYSVIGLVVAGEGRGESYPVCIDKKRCTVHWGAEIKERNARERAKEQGSRKTTKAEPKRPAWEIEQERRARRGERLAARWAKGGDVVLRAIAAALKKAPIDSTGLVGRWFWTHGLLDGLHGLDAYAKKATTYGIPRGTNAADLIRHAVMALLIDLGEPDGHGWHETEKDLAKACGELRLKVNVGALLDAANPEPKPEKKKAEQEPAATPATKGTKGTKPKKRAAAKK